MSNEAASGTEWHEAVLRELTELGLVAARDLQVRLVASDTGEAAAVLAHAFDRVTRSVRLSVGLKARIDRWRGLDARAAETAEDKRREARQAARKKVVAQALERRINAEVEDDVEAERLIDEAAERVDLAAVGDGFAAARLDELIVRLAADLGLAPGAVPTHDPEAPLPAPPPAAFAGAAEDLAEDLAEDIDGDFSDARPEPSLVRIFPPNSS